MQTPLDQIATQNHLQLAKAAVSCLPSRNQKLFAVLIKLAELKNILQFYETNSSGIQACSTDSEPKGMLDILAEMRSYCEGSEQEMLDQWIQMASMLELLSIFSSPSDAETPSFQEGI